MPAAAPSPALGAARGPANATRRRRPGLSSRGAAPAVVGVGVAPLRARLAPPPPRAAARGFGSDAADDGGASSEDGDASASPPDGGDAATVLASSARTKDAARRAVLATADRLLPDGRDVNARLPEHNGETILTRRAEAGASADVAFLLAAGADCDARSDSGWTPTHGAAEAGDVASLRALIDAGADVDAVADSGKTPRDIARQYGREEAERFLEAAGARWGVGRPEEDESSSEDDASNENDASASDFEEYDFDAEFYSEDEEDFEEDFEAFEGEADEEEDERLESDGERPPVSDFSAGNRSSTPASRLDALLASSAKSGGAVSVDAIASVYPYPLDPFQLRATASVVAGDSVVVSAPTGSGKTAVGETAIIAALCAGRRAVYTTPLKALSNQKLKEFQALFGTRRVGLKTGDVDVNSENADVVIMTTEILRNMLYPSATEGGGSADDEAATIGSKNASSTLVADGRLDDVGVVVLDEVHYLSDPGRGTVWEETVIYCPPAIQLVCLSATVGNPDDLAGWIETVHDSRRTAAPMGRGGPSSAGQSPRPARCDVVATDRRPVPLKWHFSMRPDRRMWPGLGPLLNRRGDAMNRELLPFSADGAAAWAEAQRRGGSGRGGWDGDGWDAYGDEAYEEEEDGSSYEGGFLRRGKRRNDPASHDAASSSSAGRRGRASRSRSRSRRRRAAFDLEPAAAAPYAGPSPATDRALRRRFVPHVETTVGQLVAADMLPAVWFIFSRKGCDQAARYLAERGASLVTPRERREIESALAAFEAQNPAAVRPEAIAPLLLGIASHHAGLLPAWKSLVERLFQRGCLKVVFATETLAAGVNMPARCAVLSALSKRGDRGPRSLTSNEFMQMAGRAGRRGFDGVGHVVCCQSPFEGPDDAFRLVSSPPENLTSRFSVTYGMALNLIRSGKPLGAIRDVVERSFGNYLGGRAKRDQTRELSRAEERAEALRAQIAAGQDVVEPEEWARYLKLDGRLKEERRLLKIVARQTEEARTVAAREGVREAAEAVEEERLRRDAEGGVEGGVEGEENLVSGFGFVVVVVETKPAEGEASSESASSQSASSESASSPSPVTIGLMPDGTWRGGEADAPLAETTPEAMMEDPFFRDPPDASSDSSSEGPRDANSANAPADEPPSPSPPPPKLVAVALFADADLDLDLEHELGADSDGSGSSPPPLYEGLARDGTWMRFDAAAVHATFSASFVPPGPGPGPGPGSASSSSSASFPRALTPETAFGIGRGPPHPASAAWTRVGDARTGAVALAAAGDDASAAFAARAFSAFGADAFVTPLVDGVSGDARDDPGVSSSSSALVAPASVFAHFSASGDSSGFADASDFLEQQRARVASTRRELEAMRAFSDLRRAVKLERRRVSKLAKLDERVARLRRRVSEYEAAGWDEFVRVVDVLVEEGALADPVPASARDAIDAETAESIRVALAELDAELDAERDADATGSSSDRRFRDPLEGVFDYEPDISFDRPFRMADLDLDPDDAGSDPSDSESSAEAALRKRRSDARAARERRIVADAQRRAREARRALRWRDDEEDADANGDDDRPADVADDSAAYSTAYSTAYSAGGSSNPNPSSLSSPLALTPLGEVCATLRGENELWLGVAATVAGGFDSLARPEECAGLCAALCADANRATLCAYGPSPSLAAALARLEPSAEAVARTQLEAGMDAPVVLSADCAALVEAWAAGASWDQVRRDTELDEGDVARVFRRTAELLSQMARTRELGAETRSLAKRASQAVLRPPITDLT